MDIPAIHLGQTDMKITKIGLGSMPLSIYGRPIREDAIKVLHRTFDLGITLIDTADAYCLDENEKNYSERLIYQALQTYQGPADVKNIIIATKGGLIRPGGAWETDLNPSRLRQAIRQSYESLGGEKPIPLWQIHDSPQDNKYSLKEIFQPICEAVQLKLIQYVGVSNFNIEQIKEAQTYIQIQSVQNVFNIFKRQSETDGIIKYCEDNNLTFIAYSPMGGRRKHKKLNKEKLLINLGEKYHCSTYCIVLAWILSKSKCIVRIPGASKITSIEDSIRALYIHLDQDDIEMINNHKFT
jgi:pyridoxine 4-dehydrogenase